MSKRKMEKDYHLLAESRGFKWVGGILPKNTHTKTLWECKELHRWGAKYHDIHGDNGCPYCSGKAKKTEEDYRLLAKCREFLWVGSRLPKNVLIKTWWECKAKHRWQTAYSIINGGSGCPYCYGTAKKIEKDYHKLSKSRGFKWVGKELPKNIHTKTLWKCSKEHVWQAEYNSINGGGGCPYCSGKAKKTKQDYYNLAGSRGFKWIGEAIPSNVVTNTWWECKEKKHKWQTSYNKVDNERGCPYCSNRINGVLVSKPQIKLNNMLTGSLNYPESRYRIDVAIMRRSQKIAVEYDCQYWHLGKEEHDAKRDKFLISRGWKILHVKSENFLPNKKQLSVAINYLLETDTVVYNLYLEDWKN